MVRRSNTLVKQHLTRRERKDSIWLNSGDGGAFLVNGTELVPEQEAEKLVA